MQEKDQNDSVTRCTWRRLAAHVVLILPVYILLSTFAPPQSNVYQLGGPLIGNMLLAVFYIFVALLMACFEFVTSKSDVNFQFKGAFVRSCWMVAVIICALYSFEYLRANYW